MPRSASSSLGRPTRLRTVKCASGRFPAMSDDSSDTVVVDEDDVGSDRCNVCVLGSRRPEIPSPLTVDLPSLGDPDPRVDAIVCDANALECENRVLRSRLELSTALSAGLAAHASILHDRNLGILSRAREGFDLGTATVSGLHDQLDRLRAEDVRLRDELATVRAQADRADGFETRYFALERTTTEETHVAQDVLNRERARVAQLLAQLGAMASNPATPTAPATPSEAPTDVVSAPGSLFTVWCELVAMQAQLTTTQDDLAAS
ncbi:hypothetical protein BBJ29_005884 [Phytophthora kernoviae]|uniref:Uncharacterized protein n=1 Tax=Phytophthora kernoviae TaxID=325452 RepID=A0A3F2RQ14_9STRA|nr:hypothetical protein BBP00_00005773 [Phytophthora kernoviae]RLN69556.1 hypothetical protein BBJ29_005884 [Phytophthora kernoviae]